VHLDAEDAIFRRTWVYADAAPQREDGLLSNSIVGRNLLLLSVAFATAAARGIPNVLLGITSHSYVDAQREFLECFASALNVGLAANISLHYPLPTAAPETIRAFVASHPTLPWDKTFSCYGPRHDQPCNNCYKCTERRLKRIRWGLDQAEVHS
jgi:7-cyano-7-deazaguanine synthase in queuosine biosynthesis